MPPKTKKTSVPRPPRRAPSGSVAKTLKKYRPQIYLGFLVGYVVILALGTISEVFHLNWFRWLGP